MGHEVCASFLSAAPIIRVMFETREAPVAVLRFSPKLECVYRFRYVSCFMKNPFSVATRICGRRDGHGEATSRISRDLSLRNHQKWEHYIIQCFPYHLRLFSAACVYEEAERAVDVDQICQQLTCASRRFCFADTPVSDAKVVPLPNYVITAS
jgi:hypothetical protein